MIQVHKDDIQWATTTQHFLANDSTHKDSRHLFCVDLRTDNLDIAKRRSELLIGMIAAVGAEIRQQHEEKIKEGKVVHDSDSDSGSKGK